MLFNKSSIAILLLAAFSQGAAHAQERKLDNMLNQLDQYSWQNVPVNKASQPYPTAPAVSPGYQPRYANPMSPGASPVRPFQTQTNGSSFQPQQNPFDKGNLLRVFLQGGSLGGGASSANTPKHLGDIQSNLQTARDQCQQAENDASRASSGSDKGLRLSAASSAQYHANSAREAAERAEGMAYSGTQSEKDYAQQARNAANRAQAAADRARYNAECGSY